MDLDLTLLQVCTQGLGLELVFGIVLVLVKPLLCYVLSL